MSYRAVEVRQEDAGGGLLARSRTALDPLGRTAAVTRFLWQGTGGGSAQALTTAYGYDDAGHLTTVTDPLSHSTSWSYDSAGRRIGRADAAGNQLSWILDRDGNAVRTERFETTPSGGVETVPSTADFDALGRPTAVRDALGNETRTFYDARGNAVAMVDPEGHLTARSYDSLDRLVDEVLPEGIAVHRDYDLASRLTTYRDALGNATTYDYDALGRNTTVSYPDGTAMASEYDPAGNRTGWTDPRGNAVAQVFDAAGRLTGRTAELAAGVPGPTSESFSYDSLSRLTQAIRGGGARSDLEPHPRRRRPPLAGDGGHTGRRRGLRREAGVERPEPQGGAGADRPGWPRPGRPRPPRAATGRPRWTVCRCPTAPAAT